MPFALEGELEIIDNKALLLRVRNPQQITTVIPKSRELPNNQVLVHWGLDEAQVLKNLRVKNVPSPIMGRYDWPGLHRPFDHQKTTAAFLTMNRRAFCLNEQGTGKTGSVIWAADYLLKQKRIRRVLVICPLSIMDSAWRADLFKFAMHRSVDIAYGAKDKRKAIINSNAEFVIINYDGVEIVAEDIANGGFDLIAVDECFVAGTLVATPQGERPIEQLETGDAVLTSDGAMRIKRLVRNTTTQLVEVKLGNGKTIRCTPDHPFFTDAGWVCAKNLAGRRLISGVELSCLRAGIPARNAPDAVALGEGPRSWNDLFKILRTEEVALTASGQERVQQLVARATGEALGAEDRRASSEAVRDSEGQGAQAKTAQGQWHGDDTFGAVDFRGLACGVGMELPSSVGQEAARLSYELQARLRMATSKAGAGGGWGQPHSVGAAGARPQEGSEVGAAWVESVAHIECPDGEAVYNLEVEGTPNYFVGDHWLVHNCNAYKNVQTKRWKVLNSLVKTDTWLWMMTGTPAAQSPLDAYGLAKLVNPNGVPKYFTSYRDQVMLKLTNFKWIAKQTATQTVYSALQPAIRFTKDECLDLPEMTYTKRRVELTKQQERYYNMLKSKMVVQAAGEEITSVNAAVNMSKLLQISCGAVYSDSGETLEFDIKNRYNVLTEVIDESSQKVLVFVPFKHVISILTDKLNADGYTTEVISGDVPVGKRTDIFNRFQTEPDGTKVLVIQPQSAAHGVTLTAANTVVWWGPTSSLETYAQANARVHRSGQRHPSTVVQLAGSGVERHVYNLLDNKIDVHSKIVDLYKEILE
jgi:superfamily II DNA or RNA helicase